MLAHNPHSYGKDNARREKNKAKTLFSAFYSEPQLILGEAKVMQGERNTKQKVFFVLIPEPQLILGEAKVTQGERNTLIPEPQPLLCGMKIAKTFFKITE
ncbi:MAG: hypothetical protein IJZ92_03595 [Bacteroidaceae bacterium]|nr:hypothetical protein [Bacteroidaceae bacterium]